jgi:exopolysaccharide biosynthesis polyprenyl glycosylphosphotransferase
MVAEYGLILAGPALVLLLAGAMVVAAVRRRTPDGYERVLLVGISPLMTRLVEELEDRPEVRWRIVGLVADLHDGRPPEVGPWLGPTISLAAIIDATQPTRIVIAPADRRKRDVEGPLIDARLRGIQVEDTIRTLECATGKLPIEQLSPRALLLSDGFRHSDFVRIDSTRVAARVLSLTAAIAGLVLLAPLFAVIALLIKIDSPGPVLFVQERSGMGGRPFGLWKFRTMHAAVPAASEWVRDNAHRITRVGRWLRRFRIDELPQLVNVIRGEMNLVGPRPHPVSNYRLFMEHIPHYRLREAVRPGITGWAQIRYGYANGLDEETEKMRYDLYYIKYRSVGFDLWIIAATLLVLVFDRRNHEVVKHRPTSSWPNRLSAAREVGLR